MSQITFLIPLERAAEHAHRFLSELDITPVGSMKSYEELMSGWEKELQVEGISAAQVIDELNEASLPGLHISQGGRFFSWVIGGSHDAALAADWLTSAWDQNGGMFTVAPSASIAEEIAGNWLKQILNLPSKASFAFVTGCQMAHFTCLAAARNYLLDLVGWNVETKGFYGAPLIRVICSDQRHATIDRAMRLVGFGTDIMTKIPTDPYGRMDVELFEKEIAKDSKTPVLVMVQAGDVNTGAYDDFEKIIAIARKYPSWVHVDGAFGLWAAASKEYRHLTNGCEMADSWASDGHKWLNVPYDCGYAFTAHPDAHSRSMSQAASYLSFDQQSRNQLDWNPEFSKRSRGFATYAAIRELGTKGIEDLINRTCRFAKEIVTQIGELPGVEIITFPVINQGLLRFKDPHSNDEKAHDAYTEKMIHQINLTGEAFFQPTTFKGKRCMRISVSSWRTDEKDVERTVECVRQVLLKP